MIAFERLQLVKKMTTQLLFVGLSLFQKLLYSNSNRFNKTALDADLKSIQQINFTANRDRQGCTTIFSIMKETKETI